MQYPSFCKPALTTSGIVAAAELPPLLSKQTRSVKAILIATAIIALPVLALWLVTGSACVLQATVGFPCPGCGSTRAVAALLQGDVKQALAWHPLIFLSLTILLLAAAGWIFDIKRHRLAKISTALGFVFIAAYIAVFIVRMVMYFPHTMPMVPHGNSLLRMLLRLLR